MLSREHQREEERKRTTTAPTNASSALAPHLSHRNGLTICFRTLFAPLLNPCADTAKLSAHSHQPSFSPPSQRLLTRLILQRIQVLPPLGHLGDVLPHDPHRIINLRLDRSRLGVARRSAWGGGARRVRGRVARGEVGVVGFAPVEWPMSAKEFVGVRGGCVNGRRSWCRGGRGAGKGAVAGARGDRAGGLLARGRGPVHRPTLVEREGCTRRGDVNSHVVESAS